MAVALLLGSATEVAALETRISEISIRGLRRTREHTVLEIIPVAVGDRVTEDSIELVRNELLDSGIFATAEVRIDPIPDSPDEGVLVVVVDEKWTLVPIPFFATDGNSSTGGLIVIESNLFGRNKRLISAGTLGTDGFGGFVAFVDPSVAGGRWSVATSAGTGREEAEARLSDGTAVRSYEFDKTSASFGVGYRVHPDLTVGTRVGVTSFRLISFEEGLDKNEPDDTVYAEPEFRIEYDGTVPLDVLRRGPAAEGAFRYVSENSGWEASARGTYSFAIGDYQRMRLIGAAGWGEMEPIAEADISSRDGFRTVPYQATRADRWGSASAAYDLPVVRGDRGAIVISHYWEAGGWDADTHDPQYFYGPGAALRVYVRKVAIPALGADFAYNIEGSDYVFSFTVGARM